MGILRFYLEYQTFPAEYMRNCIVTLLPSQVNEGTITLESDIPVLDLNSNLDTDELSSQEESTIDC